MTCTGASDAARTSLGDVSRGVLVALGAVAALALLLPATASAERFCVQKPACVKTGGTPESTLGSAIAAAGANGSDVDRIELGPHVYADGPWSAAANNPVVIVGAGAAKTTLRRAAAGGAQSVLSLLAPGSRVEKLRVALGQGPNVWGINTWGRVADVRVTGSSAELQIGVELLGDGRIERSEIAVGGEGEIGIGLAMPGPGTSAHQVAIKAPRGVVGGHPSAPARLVRSRVTATATGVEATFGQLAIDNVLVRALKGADGVRATGATLTVQQSTVVGEKGAANGVVSSVPSAGLGACPEASVTVRNSIVWGFKTALARTTSPGTCIGSPRANLDVAWSALEVKIAGSGDGELRVGPGIVAANPRFVAARKGNYRLRKGSPAIDRGQAAWPEKGESKRDLDGRKRVLDGDGKRGARRDLGAYEYKPKKKKKKKKAKKAKRKGKR